MPQIDQLFKVTKEQGASDLHLRAGAPPYLRLHGRMVRLDYRDLSAEEVHALIFEILSEKNRAEFLEKWDLDCSYTLPGVGRFRCNIFIQNDGMAAVFRRIDDEIKTIEELGLPSEVYNTINSKKGLVLVTGPTGSGKSTTLAALIHEINANEESHIITIEDPIEFVHKSRKSLVNQREVSSHTKSFSSALKAALREDPDIILVGELRDRETISLALTAAETGHLVFGTLHTNGAANTVARVVDVFPADQQAQIRVMLAESLQAVVSQTLIPKSEGRGMVAALEIMINTSAVANLIREGKTHQIPSAMQTGREHGMLPFERSVAELCDKGHISSQALKELLDQTNKVSSPNKPRAASSGGTGTGITKLPPNVREKTSTGIQFSETNPGLRMPFGKKKSS